jgi:hypothetical protein
MSGLTLKENVRHTYIMEVAEIMTSFPSTAAKKLKKEKVGTFSSPGRVKSGRGPGRPPKHPRVEDTAPNPPPSNLMELKVRKLLAFL